MPEPINFSSGGGAEIASVTAQATQNVTKSSGTSKLNSSTMVPNNVAAIPHEVIKAMEQSIAMDIIANMRRSQERIHEKMMKDRYQRY